MKLRTKEELGKKVRSLRKSYGLTQTELAKMMKCKKASYVCMIENGSRYPSIVNMKKLAEVFGLTLDGLICHYHNDRWVEDKMLYAKFEKAKFLSKSDEIFVLKLIDRLTR